MKKLFLCHYNGDAPEVYDLAQELRLRGIDPWIDKQGGFLIGDNAPHEARRAIREDCFGLLLYATPQAFERPFIRDVEIAAAFETAKLDKNFELFAVPRRLKFGEMSKLSQECFGFDLGQYHTQGISEPNKAEIGSLINQFGEVARMVLRRQISNQVRMNATDRVSFQFSTREMLPATENDLLQVDATNLILGKSGQGSDSSWDRVTHGLLDIKAALAKGYGRPRLQVHGSKHLTAAYLLGRVFCRASGFNLEIRQRDEYWATDVRDTDGNPFDISERDGQPGSNRLVVAISATGKSVTESVDQYVQTSGLDTRRFISFSPGSGILSADNGIAATMASHIRRNLERLVGQFPISEIHMFSAIPQGLAVMIGHNLNALPPVQLYEFDGSSYFPSYKICKI